MAQEDQTQQNSSEKEAQQSPEQLIEDTNEEGGTSVNSGGGAEDSTESAKKASTGKAQSGSKTKQKSGSKNSGKGSQKPQQQAKKTASKRVEQASTGISVQNRLKARLADESNVTLLYNGRQVYAGRGQDLQVEQKGVRISNTLYPFDLLEVRVK